MENMNFKGLEKKLEQGCYIRICKTVNNFIYVKLIQKNLKSNKEKIILFDVSENIIKGLNTISCHIENNENYIKGETTLIDRLIKQGDCSLHFYRLDNGQLLASICIMNNEQYIPVKSVIVDGIVTGIETLNSCLHKKSKAQFPLSFYEETRRHKDSVIEYQKTLKK